MRDSKARAIIGERIARLMLGNFGDAKPVGGGVAEMRVAFGPGYRLYLAEDGTAVVVLLCGGTKRQQRADIERAKRYWTDYKERTNNAKSISELRRESDGGASRPL